MRKFLGMIFAFGAIAGLSGCSAGNSNVNNDSEFSKFLAENNSYTVADFNRNLSFLGDINLNDIKLPLNELEVTNTQLNVAVETDEGIERLNGYMWREKDARKDYVYFGGRTSADGVFSYKVDFNAIQDTIDSTIDLVVDEMEIALEEFDKAVDSGEVVDLNKNGIIEPSEIIDNIFYANEEFGENVKLTNIFGLLKFNINDFESKGNGEYKLKNRNFIYEVEKMVGEKFSEDEEDYEMVDEILDIRVNYSNNHLNQISVKFDIEDENEYRYCSSYDSRGNCENTYYDYSTSRYKYEYKVGFEYDGNDISKTTINCNSVGSYYDGNDYNETMNINSEITLSRNEMSIVVKVGESLVSYDDMVALYVSNENAKTTIEFNAMHDHEEIINMNLGLIGTWLSEGTMTVNGVEGQKITAEIATSVNVAVPTALKEKAINKTSEVLDAIDELLGA